MMYKKRDIFNRSPSTNERSPIEKLADFFEQQQIYELPLDGAEAKELCLAYFHQRKDDPNEDIADNAKKSFTKFRETSAVNFKDFKVFPGLNWARGTFLNLETPNEDTPMIFYVTNSGDYIYRTHSEAFPHSFGTKHTRAAIEQLIHVLGMDWLVKKTRSVLDERYGNFLSKGQAKALINRVMGVTLTSTERSQLHELRKRFRKCKKLVDGLEIPLFGLEVKIRESLRSELQEAFIEQENKIFSQDKIKPKPSEHVLKYKCEECGQQLEVPQCIHCKKPMDKVDFENNRLTCEQCERHGVTKEIPQHCDKQMKVIISRVV